MTTAAICATREGSWSPSFNRGEQYDSDLGLYYLRARYYNAGTGRFMSRDPEEGILWMPITLHRYLYAGSNPVKYFDPSGKDGELFGYAIESSAAIPEAKLISIYGCVADAALAAADLILDPTITKSSALGSGAAVIGCVVLTPGLDELAEQGNKIVKFAKLVGSTADWGACALDVKDFVNGLNVALSGGSDGAPIAKSLESLVGCVGNALGEMIDHPGASLQALGLE